MIVTRAPFRVSFFGGGTDHPEFFSKHGGAVLGTAINKYSYVTLNGLRHELFDYNLKVSYSKIELVETIADIEHNIFRECLRYYRIQNGISLHNSFDLPALSGLGSSSALAVSIINALQSYVEVNIDPKSLAQLAIHIERDLVKAHGGWQDQIFASYGGFNLIQFSQNGTFEVTPVELEEEYLVEFEDHLLLMYTNMQRESSEIIESQLDRIEQNYLILMEMKELVYQAYSLLMKSADLADFGKLLHNSWLLKLSLDVQVSTSAINTIYDIGLANGALGGKLLGAGGGGFFLFFASPSSQEKIKLALPNSKFLKIKTMASGSSLIFKE
jgi:D-glycero-alpha-D-manno-heptose-7-phosphate kinase